MSQLLTFILALVLMYGYPIIVVTIVVAALGIPLPVTSIIMAAGSFTVDKTLNMYILIPLATTAAVFGDCIGYVIGKKFGPALLQRYTRKIGISPNKLVKVESFLGRWGIWCIFLTRWLLTPLAIPVNILSGASHFSFSRFFRYAFLGELLWATCYSYLGYFFGANWQVVSDYIGTTPAILALITLGISLLFLALSRRTNPPNGGTKDYPSTDGTKY